MNFFILSTLLLFSQLTLQISDREILQRSLDGVMDKNNLPHSSKIIPCFDDQSAHDTVVFITKYFDIAAKGTVTDLINLIQSYKDFMNALPE